MTMVPKPLRGSMSLAAGELRTTPELLLMWTNMAEGVVVKGFGLG
jgi:hypothetical protein